MRQNTIASLALATLAVLAALGGCEREAATPRAIRAHTTTLGGVAHAEPSLKAERYCAHCHGIGLGGGTATDTGPRTTESPWDPPSCYTCHGKNWLDAAFEPSPAPVDHTVINKDFHHLAGLSTPLEACASCHGGATLGGDSSSGLTVPGCELCHARLW